MIYISLMFMALYLVCFTPILFCAIYVNNNDNALSKKLYKLYPEFIDHSFDLNKIDIAHLSFLGLIGLCLCFAWFVVIPLALIVMAGYFSGKKVYKLFESFLNGLVDEQE